MTSRLFFEHVRPRRARPRARALGVVALGAIAIASGCATLDPLVETGCGDRILASGEDCDGAPASEDGRTFACIAAGAPGACHFQVVDGSCPSGFRVGVDGICRLPSGTFGDAASIPIVATGASVARFESEGAKQILLSASDRDVPIYFQGRSPVVPEFGFPRYLQNTAAAADLTGDGRDDVLEPLGAALLTFQGSAFDLRTYASDDPGGRFRVVTADAPALAQLVDGADFQSIAHPDLDVFARLFDCDTKKPGPIKAICDQATTHTVLYATSYAGPELLANGAIPRKFDDVADVSRARLTPGGQCRDLILLANKIPELDVVPVCPTCDTSDPPVCTVPARTTVKLEDAGATACPTLVPKAAFPLATGSTGDVLLVAGACANQINGLYAVVSTPTGFHPSFLSFVPGDPFGAADATDAPIQDVADIDRDGFVDFVTQQAVYLTGGKPFNGDMSFPAFYAPSGWSRAKVADLNGDGWLDVVGARRDFGLDVLLGGPFSAFAPGQILTATTVSAFAVGDFDGDGAGDIFIAEGGTPCGPNDALSIAFGRGLGFPAPPVRIGATSAASEIEAARVYDPFSQPDSIADAVLVSNCESTSLHAAAVFNGSASRVMSSPYVMRTPTVGNTKSSLLNAWSLAVADLVQPKKWGGDAVPDLVAFGPDNDAYRPTLVVVPGTDGANLASSSSLGAENVAQIENVQLTGSPALATGDVLGDDAPEILIGLPIQTFDMNTGESQFASQFYLVSRADLEGAKTIPTLTPFAVTSPSLGISAVKVGVVDVDGNGEGDAVFLASDANLFTEPGTGQKTDASGAESELIVAFRRGGELAAPCTLTSPSVKINGFAAVDIGGDAKAFVVSTPDGMLRFEPGEADACAGTFVVFGDDGGSPAASGIAAADFDGDGLDDVVVLGDTTTTILFQRPDALGSR